MKSADVVEKFTYTLETVKDPETLVFLCKVLGLYCAAGAFEEQLNDPKNARKLERAAISTLLRGYGIKPGPRRS